MVKENLLKLLLFGFSFSPLFFSAALTDKTKQEHFEDEKVTTRGKDTLYSCFLRAISKALQSIYKVVNLLILSGADMLNVKLSVSLLGKGAGELHELCFMSMRKKG